MFKPFPNLTMLINNTNIIIYKCEGFKYEVWTLEDYTILALTIHHKKKCSILFKSDLKTRNIFDLKK